VLTFATGAIAIGLTVYQLDKADPALSQDVPNASGDTSGPASQVQPPKQLETRSPNSAPAVPTPANGSPRTLLTVVSNPPGASVALDDRGGWTTPATIDLQVDNGLHSIRVDLDGYMPLTKRFRLREVRSQNLQLVLTPQVRTSSRLDAEPTASLRSNPTFQPSVPSQRPVDPAFPPASGPVPPQSAVVAPTRREKLLAERYMRAAEAMKQRSYHEAVRLLEALERDSPGYRDAAAQLSNAREGLRAEMQSALERDLAAAQAKQLEAERAAAEAVRREAERQTQIQLQQEAAARLFASIMGTWTHEEDQKTEESRTRTEELLTIGSGCSGVLTRTVSTYKKGFAGWQRKSSEQTRFTIRCDGTGRVSGDLNSQITLQGATLVLGTSTFARRR
jgi:hypothetical protein